MSGCRSTGGERDETEILCQAGLTRRKRDGGGGDGIAIGVAGFREGTNGRGGRGNGRRSGNIGEFGSRRRKHSSTGNGQGQGLRYGRGDHVGPRTYVDEGEWITQSWPTGWRGWAEKSKGQPSIPSYADLVRSGLYALILLSVSSIVGTSRCQRSVGKVMWQVAREEVT